ncbi:helix-turn-helix domain-containing protein [Streptomyces sp. PA5.6]|uniref:helix-turn-helix domain-containing protein n=1 Tax=Streptomyces sp. PA5.6 TaxID=3035651 RepID=UPI00390494A0
MARGLADFNPNALWLLRAKQSVPDGKSLTAERLAAMVGATKAQILDYENGRRVPDPPRIKKLAAALGVTPMDLMDVQQAQYWEVSDLRRATGHRAQDVAQQLGISVKSYRRFEQQGIVPARRARFLDDTAAALGVSLDDLERAITRIPAVRDRRRRATELIETLDERYVSRPGAWTGPDVDDPDLLELAALYGRPPQRTRRVLTYELSRLRELRLRLERERTTAAYDPDPARQERAVDGIRRWTQTYNRRVKAIPQRLEEFHRTAQPSDSWQVLVDLYDARATPEGLLLVPSQLLSKPDTLRILPPSLVQRWKISGIEVARLTAAGVRHVRHFDELYAALFPGIRPPSSAAFSRSRDRQRTEHVFQPPLGKHLERVSIPPRIWDRMIQILETRGAVEVEIGPAYTLKLGMSRHPGGAGAVILGPDFDLSPDDSILFELPEDKSALPRQRSGRSEAGRVGPRPSSTYNGK